MEDKDQIKQQFLDTFKELGYFYKACDKLKVTRSQITHLLNTDMEFKLRYQMLKDEIKERRKESLEEIMLETAKTPRGALHMFGWLRKNYPEQYNPKMVVKQDGKDTEQKLRELKNKFEKYKTEEGKQGK